MRMKKSELIYMLDQMEIRPGKHFGQNFLVDDNLLDFICRTAAPEAGELILEVGPGFGCLTRRLLVSGATIVAVELDKRLADYLSTNMKGGNFRLVQGDACRIRLDDLICEFSINGDMKPRWKCVANLPYSISTPFVMSLVNMKNQPVEMLFLLQKETAQRFAAKSRTKDYSAVSVIVQVLYDVEIIRTVPPQVFFPPPKVNSAIVRFKKKKNLESLGSVDEFIRMVKCAFSQRRKKLFSNLSSLYGKELVEHAFEMISAGTYTRAEELELNSFIELHKHLSKEKI